MAIVLTEQPTADGLYSAYLPIKFVATETLNPAYLTFSLLTSAGATIPNVPTYRALNVNNTFSFDASNYLKSILKVVTTTQGFSTTAIEELTDLYGKFEVVVSDTINSVTSLTSNEFYGFSNIDGLRYSNDQTANDGINRKGLLYASEISSDYYAPKFRGEYDRVILFPQMNGLAAPLINLVTYKVNRPNKNSTTWQNLLLSTSPYVDKLISVPLNNSFIVSNFSVLGGGLISFFKSFKLRRAFSTNAMFYYFEDRCNITEFLFINKYGVKENIKFQTYTYESINTKSDSYRVGGYTHTGNTNYFNTSANNVKINQDILEDFEVKGQMFPTKHNGELQDFASSPLQWLVKNSELIPINVLDGSFKSVIKSRGVEFNFKYRLAQTKPSFI
jgi:hypothetical protein